MQELSDNSSKLLKDAIECFYKKQYKKAYWFCKMELMKNRDDYFALCWYANSLYFMGANNDRKAASIYKKAIKIYPNHPLAHAGLGRIHYSNALKIHNEFSMFPGGSWAMFADEMSPENGEDVHKISIPGYADSRVGNREIAIKELETAADLSDEKQDKIDLLFMIAVLYCTFNNKLAIKIYKRILKLDPPNIDVHYHLAGCYAAIGDSKSALSEFEYIKENAPELTKDLKSILDRFGTPI